METITTIKEAEGITVSRDFLAKFLFSIMKLDASGFFQNLDKEDGFENFKGFAGMIYLAAKRNIIENKDFELTDKELGLLGELDISFEKFKGEQNV